MYQFISGMLVMGYFIAALFFVKHWRSTKDRLFVWFATAFAVLAVQRIAFVITNDPIRAGIEEHHPEFYVMRLLAFILILCALIDKNRGRGSSAS